MNTLTLQGGVSELFMSQAADEHLSPKKTRGSRIRCRTHGGLADWLAAAGGSLAITTYTSGKLVLVSSAGGKLRTRQQRLPRPMGIALRDDQLAVATQTKVLLFRNDFQSVNNRSASQNSSDAVFSLKQEFATGKLNAHDVAFGQRGIYFANTRFNCVARVSEQKNFLRVWQPPFLHDLSQKNLIARDCCHLNGLGMRAGRPAMATAFCETAQQGGWREEDRFTKGVLLDVRQDRVVARGLCMPHSPRWHKGRWWLCNSGHGTLVAWNSSTGTVEEVCSLPGFTRGLCLVGKYALVGLSKIRHKHVLDAPPVRERHDQLFAGVALVETATGRLVGSLEFVQGGREVFDVVFLPGIRRPNVNGC